MKRNGNRGFTLIELLVVIAIIGILSSVVLASLNTARNKANDAAVKSQMSSVRAQAEIFYDNGLTYAGLCSDTQVMALLDESSQQGAGDQLSDVCNSDSDEYAASAPIKSQNVFDPSGTGSGQDFWCVDSRGTSELTDAGLGTSGAFICP